MSKLPKVERDALKALESWWKVKQVAPTVPQLCLEMPDEYSENDAEKAIESLRSKGLVEGFYPTSMIVKPKNSPSHVDESVNVLAKRAERSNLLSRLKAERDGLMRQASLLEETIVALQEVP